MNDKTCETCAYWDTQVWIPHNGYCRRFPPTKTNQLIQTYVSDWCGEWLSIDANKDLKKND